MQKDGVQENGGTGPAIFFTGATVSLRGGSGFSAFAGAKHALRALAQSMARELGPRGIHVGDQMFRGQDHLQFVAEALAQQP